MTQLDKLTTQISTDQPSNSDRKSNITFPPFLPTSWDYGNVMEPNPVIPNSNLVTSDPNFLTISGIFSLNPASRNASRNGSLIGLPSSRPSNNYFDFCAEPAVFIDNSATASTDQMLNWAIYFDQNYKNVKAENGNSSHPLREAIPQNTRINFL